jgi:uncharacterized lipoprotein NlpE involved in copper resistance
VRAAARTGSAFALLAIVVTLSGCGSDDEKSKTLSPAQWADGLCGSLVSWKSSVQMATEKLKSGDVSKDSLNQAVDSVSEANSTLTDDVAALGTPPMPAAEKAKTEVEDLATKLKDETAKIKDTVAGVSGTADVMSAVASSSTSVSTMASEVSATSKELQSLRSTDHQWQQAFDQSDACGTLSSS